jgi:hypothetical protein
MTLTVCVGGKIISYIFLAMSCVWTLSPSHKPEFRYPRTHSIGLWKDNLSQ